VRSFTPYPLRPLFLTFLEVPFKRLPWYAVLWRVKKCLKSRALELTRRPASFRAIGRLGAFLVCSVCLVILNLAFFSVLLGIHVYNICLHYCITQTFPIIILSLLHYEISVCIIQPRRLQFYSSCIAQIMISEDDVASLSWIPKPHSCRIFYQNTLLRTQQDRSPSIATEYYYCII
jgi:hypothetical protein